MGPTNVDYLLPGIFVLAIAFGASQTGVAVADDLARGLIDRFRALPMARAAVLAGRTVADAIRNLFVLGLMIGVGAPLGFRFHAGPTAAFGTVAVALAVGLAFSWSNTLLGLLVRDAKSAGLAGPAGGHPAHLHQLHLHPGGHHAGVAPGLRQAQPDQRHGRSAACAVPTPPPLAGTVAWIGGFLVVTVPATVVRYRHTSAT